MQSKHQIREQLDSAGIRPNKRFGQNFLIDLNLMRLLIDTADIQKNDVVLEVGPGTEAQVLVGGAGVAVGAGVGAPAVGVDTISERDVGAVVAGEDLAGGVGVDARKGRGRGAQPLHGGGLPGIGRVGDGARVHRMCIS